MNSRMKAVVTATAVSLGLAAVPASAQVVGVERAAAYGDRAIGYHDDGTLNVFGAHIDPRGARSGGLVVGVGNVVNGVGTTVGGVVGGVTGAADDVVTGSIGGRPARADMGDGYDRPVGGLYANGRSAF